MTDNNDNSHEQDPQLTDEARRAAADSMPALLELIEQGIPARVQQIQGALHELAELSWCIALRTHKVGVSYAASHVTRCDAFRIFADCEVLEAKAEAAAHALVPWCHSSASERLSDAAREMLDELGEGGLQRHLAAIFRGRAHWEAVNRLNGLLDNDGAEVDQ